MVEGTCSRFTQFNAALFQSICLITSACVAAIGAWLCWWGSSFFGLGLFQLTVAMRIIGMCILVIGAVVFVITLIQWAISSCESRICSIMYSFVVFVAIILQVALLAYIYANRGNIEAYAKSIWSQLTAQSKVDFQKHNKCCGFEDNSSSFEGCSFSTLCKAFLLEKLSSKIDLLLMIVGIFVAVQFISLFISILLTSCFSSSSARDAK